MRDIQIRNEEDYKYIKKEIVKSIKRELNKFKDVSIKESNNLIQLTKTIKFRLENKTEEIVKTVKIKIDGDNYDLEADYNNSIFHASFFIYTPQDIDYKKMIIIIRNIKKDYE